MVGFIKVKNKPIKENKHIGHIYPCIGYNAKTGEQYIISPEEQIENMKKNKRKFNRGVKI